jgi:hypothetical protein
MAVTTQNPPPLGSKNALIEGATLVLYLIAAAIFMVVYITISTFNGNPRARYIDLVYQRAHKPYVYRLVTPFTIRALSRLIPDSFEDHINRSLSSNQDVAAAQVQLQWKSEHLNLYLIGILVMYLFLTGFLIVLRLLFSSLFTAPPLFTRGVPILALLGLFPWVNVTYLYDFSSLFFITLGMLFLVRKNWSAFLITYTIACFNKETTILLSLIFIIYYGLSLKMERRSFWKLLGWQIGIFAGVKILLAVLFRDLPGVLFEFHLLDHNLPLLAKWLKNYSPTTYLLTLILVLFFIYEWKAQPVFLRDGMWILVVLFCLTFIMGWMDEWRDYLEAFPIVFLLFLHNTAKIMHVPIQKTALNG